MNCCSVELIIIGFLKYFPLPVYISNHLFTFSLNLIDLLDKLKEIDDEI